MWTAVAVSDYYDESFGAYNGEKIFINSDGKVFIQMMMIKSGEVILGKIKINKNNVFHRKST